MAYLTKKMEKLEKKLKILKNLLTSMRMTRGIVIPTVTRIVGLVAWEVI